MVQVNADIVGRTVSGTIGRVRNGHPLFGKVYTGSGSFHIRNLGVLSFGCLLPTKSNSREVSFSMENVFPVCSSEEQLSKKSTSDPIFGAEC